METRSSKYNDETSTMSRTKKNQNLYSEINDLQLDSFNINSNSEILSDNGTTIDIDKLKDMLDKKYREDMRSKSLGDAYKFEKSEEIKLDETREYDINEILSKAREEKQSDYEVERLQKLRNTQVDILNDLNINKVNDNKIKAVSDEEKDELKSLIDTINLTEELNGIKKDDSDMDPLDLLEELKGDEDETKVEGVGELTQEIIRQAKLEAAKEMVEERKAKLDKEKEAQDVFVEKDDKKEEIEKENKKGDNVDNSFYTNSTSFKTNDFEDFNDLNDDITASKLIVRILIMLVIMAFICGIIFLLNKVLNWGLF